MDAMSDWVKENSVNQEFLKDFLLAWSFYERKDLQYQIPDLVRITGLLKSVGFHVTKVERMEGESWVPGMVNGCTVDIQCPVSKTKITMSSPEAMCHCQRNVDTSWSLSWAGATTGLTNLKRAEMQISLPPELTPGKALMIRICLSSLISIIWPRAEENIPFQCPMGERLVKSLECVFEKERDSGIEASRSLQCIGTEGKDSMLSCSINSLPCILNDSSEYKCTSTPMATRSLGDTRMKKTGQLALPSPRFQPKLPSPKSPYWDSSTAKAKRYAEMVKQREAEKKKPK
ncbi:uncharacterized protein [Hetaerina americana]|uniref:uncharacterized protein n=1 Tax=Hetaerina americana TaxID=62018 RepID=UPI003A7F42F0